MTAGQVISIIIGIGLVVIFIFIGGSLLAPYLRTQSVPPSLDSAEQELVQLAAQTEQEIVTNRVLVRLTPSQAQAIRDQLDESPTLTPAATQSDEIEPKPTDLVLPTPEEQPPESTATPDAAPAPESTANLSPILESTTIPENFPEANLPPADPGSVLGAHDIPPAPAIPELAVIEDVTKQVEFVAAAAQPTGTASALDRWIVIDLEGEEIAARVNNAEALEPIGEPVTNPSTSPAPEAAGEPEEPERAPVPAESEAALVSTRDAIHKLRETKLFEQVEPVLAVEPAAISNDPYFTSSGSSGQPYDDLWGLKRIQAPNAWDATTGSSSVTIAVLDTGLDFTHRDLQENIWENNGETGTDALGRDKKTNKVDDDGNGYLDDWRGWDFYNDDNDPTDDNGHGTHVAGTIGARGNNAADIAGIMWNVKIMPLKFFPNVGAGTIEGAAAGLRYAADKGAKVINNSWGGRGTSLLIHDAVEYASSKGSLLIAAAGNKNCDLSRNDCWYSPAIEDKVLAVSATTPHDTRAIFSNYGNKIELAAPGGDWNELINQSILSLRSRGTNRGLLLNEQLTFLSGTSMAAPHVSGVAGLVFALHPDWTHDQVRSHLQRTADDLGAPGRDPNFGYGLVNAARATGREALALNLATPPTYDRISRYPNQKIDVTGTVSGPPMRRYIIEAAQGGSPKEWTKIHDSTTPANNTTLLQWTPDAKPADAVFNIRLTVNPGAPEQIQLFRQFELYRPSAIFINNGDEATESRNVTLTLWPNLSSSNQQMRLRNTGEPWGAWQAYAETKPWTLPTGNGLKTVEAEFKYSGSNQTISHQDQILLDTSGTINRPPKVDAGPNVDVTLSKNAPLDGTVTDDGRPNPPGAVTTAWRKMSGPGTVTFANLSAVDTTAAFTAVGFYELQLSAADGEHTVTDTTRVFVDKDPQAPSYLTAIIKRPRDDELRPTRPQELPLDFLFKHLATDNLKCLSVKLDGTLLTPAADRDAYQQTNIPALPSC